MKNFKIASAIALAMGLAVAGSASAASANGGTMTFTGQLTDTTCTITGGAGTDGGQGDFVVKLGQVAANTLTAATQVANKTPFAVKIGGVGEGTCMDGKIAKFTFDDSSPNLDASTGNMKNILTGEATNVQVQMLDGKDAVINLANGSYVGSAPAIVNNQSSINFAAQFYATGATTPGEVKTAVLYKVSYN